jgi:hypothetical protein
MATTYTLIDKTTLGSSTASVNFSSIPSTYTDITVLVSARTEAGASTSDGLKCYFNGSNSSLTYRRIFGNGSAAYSDSGSTGLAGICCSNGQTANTFGNSYLYIPNYTSSNYKSISSDGVAESNGATDYQSQLIATLWSNTAAINQITFISETGSNFMSGSSFYLYGIKNS